MTNSVEQRKRRHAAYIQMLRRMVRSGISDSTASPAILNDAERVYMLRFGEVVK